MESKGKTDTKQDKNVKQSEVRVVSIPTVVLLAITMFSGAWACRSELDNYRQRNITDRLKSHETIIMELKDAAADRDKIIERLITLVENNREDMGEIKSDLRVLANGG